MYKGPSMCKGPCIYKGLSSHCLYNLTAVCFYFHQESEHRLAYLLDHYSFPASDITLNSTVLNWPTKINPVFDQSDEVMFTAVYFSSQSTMLRFYLTCAKLLEHMM